MFTRRSARAVIARSLLVVAATTALVAAGCASDDSDSGGDDGGTTDVNAEEVFPAPDPASGDPVTIGVISSSGSDSPTAEQAQRAEAGMQMSIDYANEYLGGIGGQPIELFVCNGEETPAASQDCANQMVNEEVAAVVQPFTGNGSSIVPVLTAAGIPYVTIGAASVEELTMPGAFALTGGLPANLAGFASAAADEGAESFALIAIDVPALIQAADAIGGGIFENAGVELETVPVPVGTADMTPQLEAASENDAVGVIGDLTFCSSFLQAYQTLGLDNPRFLVSICIDPTTLEAYSDIIDGSGMIALATTDPSNEDVQLYGAIAETYGDGVDPNPVISSGESAGAQALLSFVNGMKGITGPIDAAAVLAQIKAVKNALIFMGDGATYTCDGTAISLFANACSDYELIGTVNAEGVMQDVQLVNAGPLLDG
jgi:branched-chain amino acid transport system substrate-binding protein